MSDQLDEITKDEQPELDDTIEVTEAARKSTHRLLLYFDANRTVPYLAAYGKEFPDPFLLMLTSIGAAPRSTRPSDDDFDHDPLVAALAAAQPRQAGAAQRLLVTRLHARLELDLPLALQRRHGHRRPQHRLRGGDPHGADQVGPLALEAPVRGHRDLHVEVARRGPGLARVAEAAHPQPLPILDPGRDFDGFRHLAAVAPAAVAGELLRRCRPETVTGGR